MKTKTKSLLLIIGGLLLILSQCASAQDYPDYSHTDPDNIVNTEYDTSQTPTWEELGEKFSIIYDTLRNKPAYKTAEESNTFDGLKKDLNSLLDKFINSTFVKSIKNTETAKGIKKDMNKDSVEVKKEVKVTPKKKVD